MVSCPYDKAHKMSAPRLQWHLVKCKAKAERMALGLPEYHCKFNYMHLFFTQEELDTHQDQCEKDQEEKERLRMQEQNNVNRALENQDETELKAYRAA